MHASVLILLLFALVQHALAKPAPSACPADAPGGEHYTRLCLNTWDINRTYAAATDAPIAASVAASLVATNALATLVAHFNGVGVRVRKMHANPPPLFSMPSTRAGNIPPEEASFPSVRSSLSRYGWGLVEHELVTELSDELAGSTLKAIDSYFKALNDAAPAISRRFANTSWPRASTYALFNFRDFVETCTLRHVVAWRVHGVWGVNSGITNDDPKLMLRDRARQYLVEILSVDGEGRPTPVPVTMPMWPGQTRWVRNATTLRAVWGGAPQASLFRSELERRDIPAVVAAMEAGRESRDQVEAATTISGIAILILPLAFAALPVAAFADVNALPVIVYAIFTDILAALPLAIKGVELTGFAGSTHEASRTWVYAGATQADLACAQTWHATCMANEGVVVAGRAFIIVASIVMLIGIALEIAFYRRMRARMKAHAMAAKLGAAQVPQYWQNAECLECACKPPEKTGRVARKLRAGGDRIRRLF